MVPSKKVAKFVKKLMRGTSVGPTFKKSLSYSSIRPRSGLLSFNSSPASSCPSLESGYSSDEDDNIPCPSDVPEGCLAVYVGPERRRFVVHTEFLHKKVCRDLLQQSVEEFGYGNQGGLWIACEVEVFETLLWRLDVGQR